MSSRARSWRTARRGAGDWASPGSGAMEASAPSRRISRSRRQRPHRRRRDRGRLRTRLCAALERHDAVLGENREGQLGNGTTTNPGTAQPVAVSGITGATAVATGAYHTCGVLGNGTVRCWGRNDQGQLGNGTCHQFVHARAGQRPHRRRRGERRRRSHVCRADEWHGAVLGGERSSARSATARPATRTTPVQVVGISNAVDVSLGWRHSCARLGNGAVRCWGENAVRPARQRKHRECDDAGAGQRNQRRRRRHRRVVAPQLRAGSGRLGCGAGA